VFVVLVDVIHVVIFCAVRAALQTGCFFFTCTIMYRAIFFFTFATFFIRCIVRFLSLPFFTVFFIFLSFASVYAYFSFVVDSVFLFGLKYVMAQVSFDDRMELKAQTAQQISIFPIDVTNSINYFLAISI